LPQQFISSIPAPAGKTQNEGRDTAMSKAKTPTEQPSNAELMALVEQLREEHQAYVEKAQKLISLLMDRLSRDAHVHQPRTQTKVNPKGQRGSSGG